LNVPSQLALAGGIIVSLVTNFLLNRRFTFSYARQGSIVPQFIGFVGACSLGVLVNYITAVLLKPYMVIQLAALVGIVAGMGFNFLLSRFVIFKHEGDPPRASRT
jgi:dolichol-phosphate mannosyltransferase